ncbi:MAG: exodeoxyribonuclease VII large subunit [Bacteroidaceae bacterium]|nr:exodeoxyribonuclease VII large subunit [Bacteroidaceae bacterium]
MAEALTLLELNNMVSEVIDSSFTHSYWLSAEVSEVRENRGHCYLEFVQKDEFSNSLIAKARGVVWHNKWMLLRPCFEQTTGQPLSAGMMLLVQVKLSFHSLYGYTLTVNDIDPTYTLGDIAKRRREIISKLKEEGIDQMNKELELPRLLQRIAVISSATAAGYGDFCDQLNANEKGLVFYTRLFPALMQGDGVESSVIAALDAVMNDVLEWDVVVIIRGGGSVSDLSGFDTLRLAEHVAQFPLPVITGIGHERDDTVIDMVAHTRVKTPTAAAELLIHHQEAELSLVDDFSDRITGYVERRLADERNRLNLIVGRMPAIYTLFHQRQQNRLMQITSLIHRDIVGILQTDKNKLDLITARLPLQVNARLQNEQHRLKLISLRLRAVDPVNILKQGYSITQVGGKSLRSVSQLKKGDEMVTFLADGKVVSEVTEMEKSKS